MATVSKVWLKDDALVDYTATAMEPCKDFYHVFVTPSVIIFRYWKIVPPTRADSNAPPVEMKNSYDDFLHDSRCHSEIQRLAGTNTLNYLMRIAEGYIDFFRDFLKSALNTFFSFWNLKIWCDLVQPLDNSEQTSQRIFVYRDAVLCNSNDVWEKIFRRELGTPVTPELEQLAEQEGWKRLFYTNKLQLQMQLRRQKRREPAFVTEDQPSMDQD